MIFFKVCLIIAYAMCIATTDDKVAKIAEALAILLVVISLLWR